MTTKVRDIIKEMEKIAPSFLKESYDNVGLMVGEEEKQVKKVLLALDCTKEVICEAKDKDIDFIITHHPLFFKKPSKIVREDLQGWKVIELVKNDISLYSSHTNLDSVNGGINEEIVKLLGFEKSVLIEKSTIKGCESSGIGRFVELNEEIPVKSFVKKLKECLQVENIRGAIASENIKKIAVINGSGQDFFSKALALGADCIVTGDTTYHFVSDYKENGVTILDPGHFSTEWIVFLNVMKKLEDKFENIEFIHSKVSKDPYSFL
ncbi:Nif3-like dinuclear metal center hexameric protein [Clostridium sp. SHJSY1]|uniref:Nif3-like dinuclear metal center hexameric protein n=1 Tax=Clostridium sp. SHJSY1 TaxID=2942483 RepID=UPI002876F396|nr:Nif3-like dinuclear metal center hexameric protein [Clostridium sp. SHJSY1]MDS0524036.1 Nif3-like dinuclear metal center hexameric protein [Clostridium sp. SHJSY1]